MFLLENGRLYTLLTKHIPVLTHTTHVKYGLKPGVGQYTAIHAYFLAYFYPSSPFTCIFFKNLPRFLHILGVANAGSFVGPQNKIGHPAGCRFLC